MMKFIVEKLENGNYFVQAVRDNKVITERSYDELTGVVSLMLMFFEPK